MRPPTLDLLLESMAEALQTMAFICPEPPAEPPAAPATADCVSIRWSGTRSGQVQLAAPALFGQMLAANILALEPGSPEAVLRAADALQELCNITAGSLLARLCETASETPEMGLPSVQLLPDAGAWEKFLAQPQTTLLLAEGHPLAIHLEETNL